MAPLSRVIPRSLGMSNVINQGMGHPLYGSGKILRSQVDNTMNGRLIVSTRYFLGKVPQYCSEKTGADGNSAGVSSAKEVPTTPQAEDADARFVKGKYPGLGLPKAVGQPEDLPCIEFGKPTGLYNFVRHQHGDPRGHLMKDGRYKEKYDAENFHWYDAYTDVPKQKFTIVNGETMIKGKETRPMEELFGVEQTNIPFSPRRRLNLWGNHGVILKAEYCFFWIPTFIIFSLAVPCYTMIYMMDEAVDTSMTVKVIGHQWYWVYEVESPPLVE